PGRLCADAVVRARALAIPLPDPGTPGRDGVGDAVAGDERAARLEAAAGNPMADGGVCGERGILRAAFFADTRDWRPAHWRGVHRGLLLVRAPGSTPALGNQRGHRAPAR